MLFLVRGFTCHFWRTACGRKANMSVASAHPALGYYRATYNQALQNPSLEDVQKRIIAGPITVPLVVAELPPPPPKECSVANGARRARATGSSKARLASQWRQTVASTLRIVITTASGSSRWSISLCFSHWLMCHRRPQTNSRPR